MSLSYLRDPLPSMFGSGSLLPKYNMATLQPNAALALLNQPRTTAVKAPTPTATSKSSSSSFDLSRLLNNATQTTTQTTRQAPSQALEQAITGMQGNISGLADQFNTAYRAKTDTFNDVLRAMANLFQTEASGSASAAGTSALSMGLTPLEASGASAEAGLKALQSYYPAMSQVKQEGANVGIEAGKTQAALTEALALPLLSNIMSPYYQAVAGQTGVTETKDPLAIARLAMEQQMQEQGINTELLKLAQQAQQFDVSSGLTAQGQQQSAYQNYMNAIMSQQASDKALAEDQRQFDISTGTGMNKFMADLAQRMGIAEMTTQASMDRANMASQDKDASLLLRMLMGQQNQSTRSGAATPEEETAAGGIFGAIGKVFNWVTGG